MYKIVIKWSKIEHYLYVVSIKTQIQSLCHINHIEFWCFRNLNELHVLWNSGYKISLLKDQQICNRHNEMEIWYVDSICVLRDFVWMNRRDHKFRKSIADSHRERYSREFVNLFYERNFGDNDCKRMDVLSGGLV